MIKNETIVSSYDDYICLFLRNKNELYHKIYDDKILFYDILIFLIYDDKEKIIIFFLIEKFKCIFDNF